MVVLLAAAEAIAKAKVPLKGSVLLLLNLESVGRGERIGVSAGVEYLEIFQAMERANAQYVHRAMGAFGNSHVARPRQDAAHFLWAKIPTVSIGTSGSPPLPYTSYHTTKDRW